MKRREFTKALAVAMAAAMVVSVYPTVPAMAEPVADEAVQDENAVDVTEEVAEEAQTEEQQTADAEPVAEESADDAEAQAVSSEVYVLMNIPYAEFYAADGVNGADAVSSATLNKTRTSNLAAGSYHVNSDGSDITGITFPVKISDASVLDKYTQITDDSSVTITVTNRGKESTTTYEGKDTLFESSSYSYYVLSDVPSYYKEATVNEDGTLSFGEVKGVEAQTLSDVTADFTTETQYGDYQLDLSGLPDVNTVYGVVVSTKEGGNYGLRHVENIWLQSKLAWSTGFVTQTHGCELSYENYVDMMGRTINKVTYYTDNGIYVIPVEQYVPVKFESGLKVENAKATSGKTAITVSLPEDYDAEYSVDGLENVAVKGNELTFNADGVKVGSYTLNITDKSGKYADLSTSFELTTEAMPASYNSDKAALVPADGYNQEDLSAYIKNIKSVSVNGTSYAASGRGAVTIIKEDGTIDTTAKPFANSEEGQEFEIEVTATGYENNCKFTYKYEDPYTYVYAGLSWAEYWAAEGVYAAGDASSSDEVDTREEHDKGAFDTVSRATTNHGLHRGSFQCAAVIKADNGKEYNISYWKSVEKEDGTKTVVAVLTDGSTIQFAKGTITEADGTTAEMTEYDVTGLKYVPVKVAKADYEAFCKNYNVVENDGILAGGYSENKLTSYDNLVADVTAETNGLKTATLNKDGSFSFSAKATGTASGIKDQSLKTAPSAEDVGLTVRSGSDVGAYGEFIRVDLNGDYGDLGANMQAVKWTYYGDDSTYSKALATYGTKFASDNWMHKAMGIQLGLTDSLRCQLPADTDGTGYWTITITALGYNDVTYKFEATSDNIVKDDPVQDTSKLEAAIKKAESLKESDYTAETWDSMQEELQEAKEALEAKKSQAAVDEATTHLNNAIDALVKLVVPGNPSDVSATVSGTNNVKVTWKAGKDATGYYVLRSTDKSILKKAATAGSTGLKNWVEKYASKSAAYKKTTKLSYTDTVDAGKTYYYLVVSYSKDAKRSEYDANNIKTVKVSATYKVTFNKNGGSKVSSSSKTVVEGKKYGTLPTAERKGYTFKGWYTAKSGGSKVTSSTKVTLKANQTLYAQWTKVSAPAKVGTPTVKNVSTQKMKVSYKAVSGADGYRITYSTSSSFKNSKSVNTTSLLKTISGLQKGKTYYVKVRAYKLDSQNNKVYGSYSAQKSVKISK